MSIDFGTSRLCVCGVTLFLASAMVSMAADPGFAVPTTAEASDQKSGSVLVFNLFTSGASGQDTRISLTNNSDSSAGFIRLFFVDGNTGFSSENSICLTAQQTRSFKASALRPGQTGYIIAVAVDGVLGCPASFNSLSGQAEIKLSTGQRATLPAVAYSAKFFGMVLAVQVLTGGTGYTAADVDRVVAFSAPSGGGVTATGKIASVNGAGEVTAVTIIDPGSGYTSPPTVTIPAPLGGGTTATATASVSSSLVIPGCDANSTTSSVSLDGVQYNRPGRVLQVSTIPSRGDSTSTLLVLNRLGGNLTASASTIGQLSGVLYDDAENASGFGTFISTPQFRTELTNSFPATAPQFTTFIPPGRTGWMKLFSPNDIGLSGSVLSLSSTTTQSTGGNGNGNGNGKNSTTTTTTTFPAGGTNMLPLTLNAVSTLTVPVRPPACF